MIINQMSKMHGAGAYEDGQFRIVAQNGGYVHFSTDFGETWIEQTSMGLNAWNRIGMNKTAEVICIGDNGQKLWRSTDYGATWLSDGFNSSSWLNIAVSNDTGKYIMAGNNTSTYELLLSSNFGTSFVVKAADVNNRIYGVGVSETGQYMVASGNTVTHRSTNYGIGAWSYLGYEAWFTMDLCMSASGQYVTRAARVNGGDGIHWPMVSNDYGASYTTITSLDEAEWYYCDMSLSGEYQMVAQDYNGDGKLYLSDDYGVTWAATTATYTNINGVHCSGTGKYMCIMHGTTQYLSDDYGATWAESPYGITGTPFLASQGMNKLL